MDSSYLVELPSGKLINLYSVCFCNNYDKDVNSRPLTWDVVLGGYCIKLGMEDGEALRYILNRWQEGYAPRGEGIPTLKVFQEIEEQ